MEMDIVDEQIDTVGRAFLGLTLGCARCHDHKFDPIDTADYYGLAGIFKSTRTMETFKKVARWHENPLPIRRSSSPRRAYDAQVAATEAGDRSKSWRGRRAGCKACQAGVEPAEKTGAALSAETQAELKKLRDELAALEKAAPDLPSAMG